MGRASNPGTIADNRQARHNYHLLEQWEAGLALTGSEVKSLRAGQVQLKDAYGLVRNGEAVLVNCHISPYQNAGYALHEPDRARKLLLHKAEIARMDSKTREKGLTLVPLRLYWKDGRVKVELALGKGKAEYDKRAAVKKREAEQDARTVLKARQARNQHK